MRRVLNAVCLLSLTSALLFAARMPASAQNTVVNNVLSPFSSIKIIGSRPAPRPPYQWSPQCNQGFTEWKPVCAVTRNRIVLTYPNQCMAELDGAIVFDQRECPRAVSCGYTYEPVCGRLNYTGRRSLTEALKPPPLIPFINECFARTLPDQVKGEFPPPEATDELAREITVLRNYGDDIYFYPRPKEGHRSQGPQSHGPEAHGERYHYYGRSGLEDFTEVCPKSCPEGGLVVCALDHNNVFRLYKNKCSAILAGANPNVVKPGDLLRCK
jgi:hypothetical protein